MSKKLSPDQLKQKDEVIRRGFETLTNSKPSDEDIKKLTPKQQRSFYKAGKQKKFSKKAIFPILLLAAIIPAVAYGSYRTIQNNREQNPPKTEANTEAANVNDSASPSTSPDNTSDTSNPSSSSSNNNSPGAASGQQNQSSPNNQSTSNPASPTKAKINDWNVYIYQTNIDSCGFAGKPACPWPGGLIISIVAKNEQTGEFIPLKDCSMTASPVGFSLPGGSFSANPSVYKDAGVPVCGGGYDFPTGGQYRLNYEIWLADGLNVDMPYRGGLLTNFSVQPR